MNSELKRKLSVLTLITLIVGSTVFVGLVGTATAQSSAVDNATDAAVNEATDTVTNNNDGNGGSDGDSRINETKSVLYQFDDGGAVLSVEYRDGSTWITIEAPENDNKEFAISEGDLESTGGFEYKTVSVPAGEVREFELAVTKASVVVTSRQDGFYYQGTVTPPVVLGQTTDALLRISAIAGAAGAIMNISGSVVIKRRKHKDSYKELFSEEQHKIDKSAYETARDKLSNILSTTSESRLSTIAGVGVLAYIMAVVTGFAAPPGEIWVEWLTDGQRLILLGTLAMSFFTIVPVYFLVDRIYQIDKDFIIDLDSRDTYKAAAGDQSGSIAVYSGPTELINKIDVDGALTRVKTPGGGAYLVRGFDPEANTAAGNPPELDNDRLVSIHERHIAKNRGILKDLATIGRDLLAEMPAFRVVADTQAMKDMDAGVRDAVSAGNDSIEGVLQQVTEGTRYEGAYKNRDDLLDEFEEEVGESPLRGGGEGGETGDEGSEPGVSADD